MSRRTRVGALPRAHASLLSVHSHLLGTAEAHYRRAVAAHSPADPVVVVEVLDRPAKGLDEAITQVDAEDRRGIPVAVGVQSRAWVAGRLRPCSARAANSVRRGGGSPARPLTLVVISGAGIDVADFPCGAALV